MVTSGEKRGKVPPAAGQHKTSESTTTICPDLSQGMKRRSVPLVRGRGRGAAAQSTIRERGKNGER